MNIAYRLSRCFTLASGVLYANKGYEMGKIYFVTDVGSSSEKLEIGSLKLDFNYVDVPLKVNLYLTTKELRFFLSTGISGNIFITRKPKAIINGKNTETNSSRAGFSAFNFSVLAGFGIDYELSKKLNLRFQPQYQRFITSILDESIFNEGLNEHLYSYGINLDIYYKF
ncbi:MAG: PorT family protein [Deltaproteobacteria bacterium]|nr:PorT family protein [Deltaproteobacteria bacterium]